MSIVSEFKGFAMKGSVVDLAVGVVIGGAFGAIVTSLVGDIIMPIIGIVTGGIDFSGLAYKVGGATIAYGFNHHEKHKCHNTEDECCLNELAICNGCAADFIRKS